jgi:replicative DNA helicase
MLTSNLDAEGAVLGAVLLDPGALAEVADRLTAEDFYSESNRLIWQTVCDMTEEGGSPDLLTVTNRLRSTGLIERAGGAAYVSSLVDVLPAVSAAPQYADIVREMSLGRKLQRIIASASHCESAADIMETLQAGLDGISRDEGDSSARLADIAAIVVEHAGLLATGKRSIQGVATGIEGIDRYITTLHPGELYILAARPSIGKTSLACTIAANVTRRGGRVLFVSLEMAKSELVEKLIAAEADIDTRSFRTGKFNLSGAPNDIERAHDVALQFRDWDMVIDDRSTLTAASLRALSRRVQSRRQPDLIVIDYLQLMTGAGQNKNDMIGNISRSLKNLSKDLKVPVLCLSQLSRLHELEGRGMRPRLSDLRDSGAIEQDADKVIFLVRDKEDKPRVAQAQIAKNRQGPIGDAPLDFNPAVGRFTDGKWEDWVENK